MKPIRTVIADDQPLARERLQALLTEERDVEVVAAVASGREAVDAIAHLSPDLVFLDIQMPELDGIAVVERVGIDRMPLTIFVTAYDEYAVRAFELHAIDYLLKPFGRTRLQAALERVRSSRAREQASALAERLLKVVEELRKPEVSGERLLVRSGGRVSFVPVDGIDWIAAEGNYVRLHAGGESHVVRETMTSLQARLGDDRFFRIHRSALVNVTRIREIHVAPGGDYDVVLQDGERLPLSRLYREALQKRLLRGS